MLRIGLVAAVLQSFVLPDRRRVGEMHMEADVLQSIDQPIPVVSRLDHHAGQFILPPSQEACDLHDVVGQALLRHNPIASITATTLLLECRSIPLYIILASSWSKVIR